MDPRIPIPLSGTITESTTDTKNAGLVVGAFYFMNNGTNIILTLTLDGVLLGSFPPGAGVNLDDVEGRVFVIVAGAADPLEGPETTAQYNLIAYLRPGN